MCCGKIVFVIMEIGIESLVKIKVVFIGWRFSRGYEFIVSMIVVDVKYVGVMNLLEFCCCIRVSCMFMDIYVVY